MDRVCEELDEAKAELKKLRFELKCKAEQTECLRKAHNQQMSQIQQSNMKIEKQAEDLNEKTEELSSARQMCGNLQRKLNEKKAIIKQLSSANDKLRVDSEKKYRELEEEKRELVLALDEANERNIDQEQKINVCMAEIEVLKGLLSASHKKLSEAEKKAKACKELRERDEMLLKLEEENMKNENNLKWKKEQFKHLEEAHEKLWNQLRENTKEWELEKSNLFDEICRLNTSLDSQTRMCENLQNQLNMVNQALSHEESRRKYLEIEICEYKVRFESVFAECQDTKSKLEHLTSQRDKEIVELRHSLGSKESFYKEAEYQARKLEQENQELLASLEELRHSLGSKESFYKEAEYQARKLEQENQELLASLEELREAQIQGAGNSSSMARIRNKLRNLENIHRDCSANLRAKEAEWGSQLEKLIGELESCKSTIENKEKTEKGLKTELDARQNVIMQLELQNKEASIILLVLKSVIAVAELAETSFNVKERDEKDTALSKALEQNREERQKAQSLLKRVESLEHVEEQRFLVEKELETCKEVLQEREKELTDKIGKLSDALDTANTELCIEREKAASLLRKVESFNLTEEQLHLMEKEPEKYKQLLEESTKFQVHMQNQALQKENESQKKLKQVSDALERANAELAAKICEGHAVEFELWIWESIAQRLKHDLEETQALRKELEASLLSQIEVAEIIKQEKDGLVKMLEVKGLVKMLEVKDSRIDNLQQQIELHEQELKTMSFESESLIREFEVAVLGHEKIDELLQLVRSLEEKLAAAEILTQLEIEEKKLIMLEFEKEIYCIQKKLEAQGKSLSSSQQQALSIEAKHAEMKKLMNELETKLRTSEALVDELEIERASLVEDVSKLSNVTSFVVGLGNRISQFSHEDMQLLGTLERMVESLDDESPSFSALDGHTGLVKSVKQIVDSHRSPKKDRLPFRELN